MRRSIAVTAALLGGALIVAAALLGSVLVAEILGQPAFAQNHGHIGVHPARGAADAQTMPSRR
jgi:hypothetical protein